MLSFQQASSPPRSSHALHQPAASRTFFASASAHCRLLQLLLPSLLLLPPLLLPWPSWPPSQQAWQPAG
jgi:hypothetical protein